MPLTRDFRDTVKARAESDPAFRAGLYQEALQEMLAGEFGSARVLLRDFINATIGFSNLAKRMGVGDKSLMRMFGQDGNPTAENLLAALRELQKECGLTVKVQAQVMVGVPRRGRALHVGDLAEPSRAMHVTKRTAPQPSATKRLKSTGHEAYATASTVGRTACALEAPEHRPASTAEPDRLENGQSSRLARKA